MRASRRSPSPGAKQSLFPIPEMAGWGPSKTDGRTREEYAEVLGTDKGRLVFAYWGFVKGTGLLDAAAWARRLGYKSVRRHAGGSFAWKGAGYPTEGAR